MFCGKVFYISSVRYRIKGRYSCVISLLKEKVLDMNL